MLRRYQEVHSGFAAIYAPHGERLPQESRFDSMVGRLRQSFYRQAVAPSPSQRKKDARQAPAPLIEFTGSAHEFTEQIFDATKNISTNTQAYGPIDVKAYGYLRNVVLEVHVTGLTGGTAHEDAPFNLLDNVALRDVNGGWIQHPVQGFDLFCENLYGGNGIAFQQDPRLQPDYDGATPNFDYFLRIPVEILANNGLGALGNQNAAAVYQLTADLNTIANVWTVAPTGTGAVRLRCWTEAWTQPRPQSLDGRLQAVMPPDHGTTQEWSKQVVAYNSGDNQLQLKRVGNLIKSIILINRNDDAPPVRNTSEFPDPLEVRWDSKQLFKEPRSLRRNYMIERTIHSSSGIPTGVFSYSFAHDVLGHNGNGTPELYLPTMQSTRFEFVGNFGGAGSLTILTNDVLPVETDQGERYDFEGATGFVPAT